MGGEVLHAWRENAVGDGDDDTTTVATTLDERATGTTTTTASSCGFGKRERGAEAMDILVGGALRDGEEELDWEEEDPEEKRLAKRRVGEIASGIGKMRLAMRRNGGVGRHRSSNSRGTWKRCRVSMGVFCDSVANGRDKLCLFG